MLMIILLKLLRIALMYETYDYQFPNNTIRDKITFSQDSFPCLLTVPCSN